jgi:hypothetical protein
VFLTRLISDGVRTPSYLRISFDGWKVDSGADKWTPIGGWTAAGLLGSGGAVRFALATAVGRVLAGAGIVAEAGIDAELDVDAELGADAEGRVGRRGDCASASGSGSAGVRPSSARMLLGEDRRAPLTTESARGATQTSEGNGEAFLAGAGAGRNTVIAP